jgi:hypothetical protein
MPVPEGRMRAIPILPQHLIRENLVPLAKDGGGPIPLHGTGGKGRINVAAETKRPTPGVYLEWVAIDRGIAR